MAMSHSLRDAATGIDTEFRSVSETTTAIEAVVDSGKGGEHTATLQLWTQMQQLIASQLGRALDAQRRLDENIAETRFRVALARLQSSMLTSFIAELIDGGDDAGHARPAIAVLVEVVRVGIESMRTHAAEHQALTAQTADLLERTVSIVAIPRQLLGDWRATVRPETLPRRIVGLLPQITAAIDGAGDALHRLEQLAQTCRSMGEPDSTTELLRSLDAVATESAALEQ